MSRAEKLKQERDRLIAKIQKDAKAKAARTRSKFDKAIRAVAELPGEEHKKRAVGKRGLDLREQVIAAVRKAPTGQFREILDLVDATHPTVNRHLTLLVKEGVVTKPRRGVYELAGG